LLRSRIERVASAMTPLTATAQRLSKLFGRTPECCRTIQARFDPETVRDQKATQIGTVGPPNPVA